MRFRVRFPLTGDRQQQANTEDVMAALNSIGDFIYWGDGAPTFTPPGRAVFIRRDGGAATTFYVYEGAGWVGK